MEFVRFIFSSFWVWLGFVIMLLIIGVMLVELVKACKRNRISDAQVTEDQGEAGVSEKEE